MVLMVVLAVLVVVVVAVVVMMRVVVLVTAVVVPFVLGTADEHTWSVPSIQRIFNRDPLIVLI